MKGIILGGGNGSRLYPLTLATNKLLIPLYDKPMVYYPLASLMQAGIRDVMIISNNRDLERFKMVFGDGSSLGMNISYGVQEVPTGIVSAFLIGEEFIKDEECALILGDNLFYGPNMEKGLMEAERRALEGETTLFGYRVADPERFGIVELDESNRALSIEEKPKQPKSNVAVTGLYFYPKDVVQKAKMVKPSARGEYEITDLNNLYLKEGNVRVVTLEGDDQWFDAGTFDSLLEASERIQKAEQNGLHVGYLEEIAYQKGWISKEQLLAAAQAMSKNSYGQHLYKIANE